MFYIDENFLKNLPVNSIGKIIKNLISENTELLTDVEQFVFDNLNKKNKEIKSLYSNRTKKAWEKRKQNKTLPAPAPAPAPVQQKQPPKKLTLKEKNPVFWEAIQRKKHVLIDELI